MRGRLRKVIDTQSLFPSQGCGDLESTVRASPSSLERRGPRESNGTVASFGLIVSCANLQ